MSTIRFRSSAIDLELTGSESFVNRQLHRLTPYLGSVDEAALDTAPALENQVEDQQDRLRAPNSEDSEPAVRMTQLPPRTNGDGPEDALLAFYNSFPPNGRDKQIDAALLFAYYLQNKEGKSSLGVGDLIRCCIRAGVDTRNFNRVLGTLTRRGFLETVRHGHGYQLSERGVAAVESRM